MCLAAAGFVIGLRPLVDNSFFTHLATGRLILRSGSVPSVDPYTFTAQGEPWVVQSWLASWLYASTEALSGAAGLRILMGVVAAGITVLAWRLARPATSLVPRLGIVALFLAASAELWAERPLMLGLAALGCAMLVAEGGVDPRWLVPIGWLWVNVHGSFPLGIVYLGLCVAGAHLDGRPSDDPRRGLGWLTVGVLAGAAGPLGPRVLLFPVELLQRQDLLRNVVEWRAPTFDSFSQRAWLLQVLVSIVLLARRPSYRHALLMAAFIGAALLGMRNLPVAALVLVPVLASGAPSWGTLRSGQRSRIGVVMAGVGVAGLFVLGSARLQQRHFELRGYPVDAVAFVEAAQIDLTQTRMATQDVVGNFLELVYGDEGIVFYDDRFDMFPDEVSEAHLSLINGSAGIRSELGDHHIELLTWERASATGQRIAVDPDWRVVYTDESWIVACRRGALVGGRIGRC